jgi:cytochrome c-type biogenesis protein CcmH
VTLGETQAAQDALNRAMTIFAQEPESARELANLGSELQLSTSQHSTDTAQIADMVERLAARMKENPDNLEGWIMLGRSYTVLGETEMAREAIDNAARLAPDNPDVLTLQARMIRAANNGRDDGSTIAILRRVLEMAPDNPEALWFVGNAEADAGNNDEARKLLGRLLELIPEGNPQKAAVQQRINEIGG